MIDPLELSKLIQKSNFCLEILFILSNKLYIYKRDGSLNLKALFVSLINVLKVILKSFFINFVNNHV